MTKTTELIVERRGVEEVHEQDQGYKRQRANGLKMSQTDGVWTSPELNTEEN